MRDERLPQGTGRQLVLEIVFLALFSCWSVAYFYQQMTGIAIFYQMTDFITFMLMAGVYGFFSLFLLDFARSWVYYAWGGINLCLLGFSVYRLVAMLGQGAFCLVLNSILVAVPVVLFGIMWYHLCRRDFLAGQVYLK
ncbi:MAG: hypothetical protein KHX08_04095 [Clostridiales bacterium]|nr:hypothetical protein [Clostridiales bacterium]